MVRSWYRILVGAFGLFAVTLVMGAASAGAATPVTLDFEATPPANGATITTQYNNVDPPRGGVEFTPASTTATPNISAVKVDSVNGAAHSGSRVLQFFAGSGPAEDISASFDTPRQTMSFYLSDPNGSSSTETFTLTGYDAANAQVAQTTATVSGYTSTATWSQLTLTASGSVSSDWISKWTLASSSQDDESFYLDDLSFSVPQPPTADFTCSPCTVDTGTPVQFTSSTNAASPAYSWDLNGDGTFGDSTAANPIHTYANPGTYTVGLTVTDSSTGGSTTVDHPVSVYAPPAVITQPASSVHTTQAQLNGSLNPENAPVSSCSFQFGTTTSYGQTVSCASLPSAGGSAVPVSATIQNLSPGTAYHYRLVAQHSFGQAVMGSDATFTTPGNAAGSTSTSSTTSSTPSTTPPANCDQQVTFALTQVTTSNSVCLNQQSDGSYQTDGPLVINGIPLPAVGASTPYVITPPSKAHPGGLFGLLGGSLAPKLVVSLGGSSGFAVDAGAISWNLPATSSSNLGTVATLTAPSGQSVKGLAIAGSIQLSFGRSGSNYYSSFAVTVGLPSVFKQGPNSSSGGITGTVGVRVDSAGVHFDGLIVQVKGAYIGSLQVKSACFAYGPRSASGAVAGCPPPALTGSVLPALTCQAGGGSAWSGGADVVLPISGSPELSFYGGFTGSKINSLSVDASGLKVPIAEDVFLTNIGLQLCLPNSTQGLGIEGDVGVGAVATGNNFLASVNGSFRYEAAFGSNPWSLQLGGSLAVEGTQVGSATLAFGGTPVVTFDVKVGVNFSVVSVNGELQGFFETARPYQFSVEGNASACLQDIGCLTADAAVSSRGLAGCVGVAQFHWWTLEKDDDWAWYAWWRVHWVEHTTTWQAGFGYYWGGSVSLWGDSCDVGDYEIPTPVNTDVAGLAGHPGAAVSGQFTVPAHSPGVAVRITGVRGAPRVRLTGPGGVVINPPANGKVGERVGKLALVEEQVKQNTTSVLLLNPRAGRWHLAAVRGSVKVASVRTAPGLAPPEISGGLSADVKNRVGGGIAYAVPSGETLTLYVSGPHHVQQLLGVAHGKPCPKNAGVAGGPSGRLCQRISFTPAYGPNGRRTVYAVVSRRGLVVSRVTVGSVLVKFAKPAVLKVKAVRTAGGVKVTWTALAHTADYAVAVDTSDGRRLSFTTRSNRLTVPGVAATESVKVLVWPAMADGVIGKRASTQLKVTKAKPKPKPKPKPVKKK